MSARFLTRRAGLGMPRLGMLNRPAIRRTAHHNAAVTIRNASFSRILPKLALKFIRIPAMFGGVAVGGIAYLQYQTVQAGAYAANIFNSTKDAVAETTSNLYGEAKDIARQTILGFDKTREEAKEAWAAWMQSFDTTESSSAGGGSSGSDQSQGGNPNGQPPRQSKGGMGAATTAAVVSAASTDADSSTESISADPQMLALTKEMIEIRGILQKVGQSSAIVLPSIVVVGSQSSGKSSVLEAIVGHDFLPKGSNMVTRRPIELTLVNTPDSTVDYGEFPDMRTGKITDFAVIRKMLTDLNRVPDSVCVSDEPIQLRICSRNVPDLSLIDLPGYIQVEDVDQPTQLRHSIAELCEKYIKAPNIILAVSSADADLANSTALQASRRADPRGERTIGVLTKMDLVEPEKGLAVLKHNRYPLRLGYVGVITKAPPPSHGLFKKGPDDVFSAMAKNEAAYFSSHPEQFGPTSGISTGTVKLRHQLTKVLEQTLSANMKTTGDAIQRELKNTSYKLKAQFGDRTVSAGSYLSASLDDFKHHLRAFRDMFGQLQMHDLVKSTLDDKVLDLLAANYWNPRIHDLSVDRNDAMRVPLSKDSKDYPGEEYLESQLAATASAFAGCGVGQISAKALEAVIRKATNTLVDHSQFRTNDLARKLILDETAAILEDRHDTTTDGVEHAIKPYKFGFRIKEKEWQTSRQNAAALLKKELKEAEDCRKQMEATVGDRRKLRDLMSFIHKARCGEVQVDNDAAAISGAGGFTADLLQTGKCLPLVCPKRFWVDELYQVGG